MKVLLLIAAIWTITEAVTTSHLSSSRGFQPSNYYRLNDQIADASVRDETILERLDAPSESGNSIGGAEQRTQRFGITAYGGNGVQVSSPLMQYNTGGYPSASGGSPGIYGPVKIDLGGVLLGSLIGLGAVLILPKLVHAFSYSYGGGGYGRSVEADMSSFTALLTKFDDMLEKNNIDSSTCAQRITCSYIQSALDNVAVGNATEVDRMLSLLSDNGLVSYMLDGTAIKQAIEAGKQVNTDCQSLYSRCQLDKQAVMKILTGMIPTQ